MSQPISPNLITFKLKIMRKLRKNYIFLPLLVLTLVLFNHKAYSFVGEYTATSASTIANNSYQGNE